MEWKSEGEINIKRIELKEKLHFMYNVLTSPMHAMALEHLIYLNLIQSNYMLL